MRLLDKTVRSYILYSGILLLIAIPVFYFVLSSLVIQEIDEVLLSHKRDFIKSAANFKSLDDIEHYPLLNEEFFITPNDHLITTDSFYTEHIVKPPQTQTIPFRVVKTGMTIQGHPYELLVKESLLESEDLIFTIVYTQTVLIALLLAGLIFINRGLTKKIWRPFYDMLYKLKQYDINNHKNVDLGHSKINEFEDMRQTIVQLLSRNHKVYLSQKEFTENASHEMQTPLAVAAVKLDLLMQTENISKEQADLIEEVINSTHQLSQLNRSLLLLAKIENDQFREITTIPVGKTIRTIAARLQELSTEKELVITEQIEEFELEANVVQIDILLSNLLSNAIRHSAPKSAIVVMVANNGVTISNPGQPLRNPDKIFDRFQRDVTQSSGSGIGLALVSRICELNRYQLSYHYKDAHHYFQIVFR